VDPRQKTRRFGATSSALQSTQALAAVHSLTLAAMSSKPKGLRSSEAVPTRQVPERDRHKQTDGDVEPARTQERIRAAVSTAGCELPLLFRGQSLSMHTRRSDQTQVCLQSVVGLANQAPNLGPNPGFHVRVFLGNELRRELDVIRSDGFLKCAIAGEVFLIRCPGY